MTARQVATSIVRAVIILVVGAVLVYIAFSILIVILVWIAGGTAEGMEHGNGLNGIGMLLVAGAIRADLVIGAVGRERLITADTWSARRPSIAPRRPIDRFVLEAVHFSFCASASPRAFSRPTSRSPRAVAKHEP